MTTIADKIIEYLKAYGDKRVKIYYYGDPLVLPISNLPAVIVENRSSIIQQGATGLDELENVYSIKVVMSKKDEIGKNPEEMAAQRTLSDIIMKRDSNNQYEASSIMGILRKYFTLGTTIEDQTATVEFFMTERGELITEEAEILINIKDFVNVPTRT
jgi:hypothetical protein